MPPRVGPAASGVGDPHFRFLLSVLKHCEQVKTDWNEVAKENGIAYGRNATARFKSIIENNGLKFENGKVIIPSDGVGNGVAGAAMPPPAPTAAATAKSDDDSKVPKRAKKQTTPRKRKSQAAAGGDGDEPAASSASAAGSAKKKGGSKKKMKSEAFIKTEEDAEDDSQVNEAAPGEENSAKMDAKSNDRDETGEETRAEKTIKTEKEA